MLILIVLGLLLLIQLAIGLLIFFESQRTKKIEHRVFSLMALTVLLWTVFNAFLAFIDQKGNAKNAIYFTRANQIAFVLGSISLLLIYIFSNLYPLRKKFNLLQKTIVAIGAFLAIISPTSFVAGRITISNNKLLYHYGRASSVFIVYVLLVVVALIGHNLLLIRNKKVAERLKKQSITLLTGFSLTIVQAILFIIILPPVFNQSNFIFAIGYAAPFYLILFTGYSLLKQGLFDIRLIVARSVAYVLTLAAIGLIFITPTFILTTVILHRSLGAETIIILVIATLAVSILFQTIKSIFNKISNKVFFRDYYEIQDVLDKLGNLLVSSVNPQEINKKSSEILGNAIKPVTFEYLLSSNGHQVQRDRLLKLLRRSNYNIAVLDEIDVHKEQDLYNVLQQNGLAVAVRLRTKHEDLGYLLLGYKRSGQIYSETDKRLLTIAADEIAISLQNALRFEEIQQFNVTLQQKVDEATVKLRRANDKLRALDETKDDFISMASHQLRTPLTSVKGYLSMVLDGDVGKVSKTQKDMLGQAFFSSQRMVYLIADLLNVSRLKTGKFVIESAPVNLAEVVSQEVSQLEETAGAKSLKLIYNKPKTFPTLMLDETKTRQVIMNFADNAIYYTPAGGNIEVKLIDNPQTVELRIIDNGIGVPKAEQHHLFTKFYRAGNARKARPDGTGLGLFMAKKVVAAEGGSIIFESQEGKGSTFGFVFSKTKLSPKADATAPAKKATELATV